jgi:deazaflavin-dependent oxidoreductase (nitroreductase family)
MSSEPFLYLVTRGRKTGKPRVIEIWFVELDGRYYIVSERGEASQWVKNLRAHADVFFSVGARENRDGQVARRAAQARALDDSAEPELTRRVRSLMDAKYDFSAGLVVEILPRA